MKRKRNGDDVHARAAPDDGDDDDDAVAGAADDDGDLDPRLPRLHGGHSLLPLPCVGDDDDDDDADDAHGDDDGALVSDDQPRKRDKDHLKDLEPMPH